MIFDLYKTKYWSTYIYLIRIRHIAVAVFLSFCLQVSSQTIIVTLPPGFSPNFGNQCVNTFSSSRTYVVSGTGLVGNITITAPADFEIRTGNTAYSSSIILSPIGGNVPNTNIDARFYPASAGFTGNDITHTSPSAPPVPLAVDGTGTTGGTCNSFFLGNGAIVKVNPAVGAIPTLHVNGDINSKDAIFTNNSGIIELTGDWYNFSSANAYVSTGIERFNGAGDQTISGHWDGTSGNQNQFYDLKIDKSSTTGEYVSLLDSVNINSNGSLEFENLNGIIRTQATSVGVSDPTTTGNYLYSLYLRNPDPSMLIGYSTGTGATTKYIEGKLKRQVDRADEYYFPVGVNKNYLGGMNAFQLKFNLAPSSTAIVGYLQPSSTALVTSSYVYCDVAQVDANPVTPNFFSTCIGPPDGIIDEALLTDPASHEWIATPYGTSSWNYDIGVYPSVNLNSTASYAPIPCGPYNIVKYIARDGVPGGNLATLQPAPGFGNQIGYFMCITRDTLPAQTGFSNFQIWGADNTNTSLPVELLFLKATAINNEYIRVDWATASEKNNKGFVLERSTNGIDFDSIAWLTGYGTTPIRHDYLYNDYNVAKGIIYYYRLRQVDFSGRETQSIIVSARLTPYSVETIFVYPNPTTDNAYIQVISPVDRDYTIVVYDAIGQIMYSSFLKVEANRTAYLQLHVETWARGMYLVQAKNDERIVNAIKFIKK